MNLLHLAQEQLTPFLVKKVSEYLGESPDKVTTGFGSAFPAILAGIMNQASTTEGVSSIFNSLKNTENLTSDQLTGSITSESGLSNLMSAGSGILSSIFGNKTREVSSAVSSSSGLSTQASSSLMSIAAPILMGVLGRYVSKQNIGLSGLATMLMGQKDNVLAALPAGLGSVLNLGQLGDFLGSGKTEYKAPVTHTVPPVRTAEPVYEESKGGMGIWPWIIGAGLLIGGFMFFKGCDGDKKVAETSDTVVATADTAIAEMDTVTTNVVQSIRKKLSTGIELSFGENSIENQLITFIEDKSLAVDKETWFNFKDLNFKTGSNELDEASIQEVKNISEILKAYPNVNIKIGGYTDNTGKADANLTLSKERAKNVRKALEAMGIDTKRLEDEGYGQEHPVSTNDTAEGRAQNRRIAVRVTKK